MTFSPAARGLITPLAVVAWPRVKVRYSKAAQRHACGMAAGQSRIGLSGIDVHPRFIAEVLVSRDCIKEVLNRSIQ